MEINASQSLLVEQSGCGTEAISHAAQIGRLGHGKILTARIEEVHARIKGGLSDCEESVRHKILWENAQRLYKAMGPSAVDEIAAVVQP